MIHIDTPTLQLFLGGLVLALGMGMGWTFGAWIAGLVIGLFNRPKAA
jgi:hypothetical protein